MKAVNLKSLISVYLSGNADLFSHYVSANGISDAQQGLREAEMDDIIALSHEIENNGGDVRELDNFYIGYSIPQIGKEFDLLRFGEDSVVNIEIKHSATPQKVEKQLMRNAYYLSFLDCEDKHLYSFVCDSATLYRWNGTGVEKSDIQQLLRTLRHQPYTEIGDIDSLFDPTNYLVSPFNSTAAFATKRYFLTKHQEDIKRAILTSIQSRKSKYMAITGRPGTGKTLLVYDIVSELRSLGNRVLVLHCAGLNEGQEILNRDYGWEIKPTRYGINSSFGDYRVIVVDEAQRIYPVQLKKLLDKVRSTDIMCIFSYDDGQCLSYDEIKWQQSGQIESLCNSNVHRLTAKIRTNKEIAEFIRHIMHRGHDGSVTDFPHVSVSYCKTLSETKDMLQMYKSQGWKVPVYTPGIYSVFHYEQYHIQGESAHQVIGQEFDNIVAVIDSHFGYDENGSLVTSQAGDQKVYSQTKMFYQIVTRTRKRLHILVMDNPTIMTRILEIIFPLRARDEYCGTDHPAT